MPKPTTSNLVIGLLYVAFLGTLIVSLVVARERVMKSDGSATAQQDWQKWRTEVERQRAGNGPVVRRVPKSAEPPSLVLLRDHFATSLTILVVLSSALYFTLAIMFRGALAGPSFQPDWSDTPQAEEK
ncbi:MAG: hypothetical protein H6821_10750 [Planctomycetaceae bacterium]|nr:hypothetical protein [Planctomycetales bacterium]MCB9874645.1 hypothetical protein [Planctomycetaceae bacterium]MCB9936931.1 hypothetical protein [Planctomycetaceae bacterium]